MWLKCCWVSSRGRLVPRNYNMFKQRSKTHIHTNTLSKTTEKRQSKSARHLLPQLTIETARILMGQYHFSYYFLMWFLTSNNDKMVLKCQKGMVWKLKFFTSKIEPKTDPSLNLSQLNFHWWLNKTPNLNIWPQNTYSNFLVEQSIWVLGWVAVAGCRVCVCTWETRNTCHIHVLCAVRLPWLGNYSKLRAFILGVCCVIVASPLSFLLYLDSAVAVLGQKQVSYWESPG